MTFSTISEMHRAIETWKASSRQEQLEQGQTLLDKIDSTIKAMGNNTNAYVLMRDEIGPAYYLVNNKFEEIKAQPQEPNRAVNPVRLFLSLFY